MTVRCEKHPQLRIYDLGIRFTGGIAEVTDAAKLDTLRGMTGYGFIFEGAEPDIQEPVKSERDLLKERAAALGLTFPGNISNANLAALIEQESKSNGGGENNASGDGNQ